ncbi:hypothetical protein TTHERM_00470950 (macronuclear) [Tetrahymena thermophila SB210]|uniref:Uncharacterized protein n=1 Tax=Tetrahymena thermophila (strain SB210) TaxID=312017 RepID=I7M6J5_TETTS|nr:hypothetical protein TTHERM_00470950 [Tetrahymena thermophila SB210]EAR85322.2 hypothetical protein TTHERM_00470950 [Tetrahymena thermophila SB210]|eukprot:XP_001032985.2 hypothetical protein TTHERM_00470950 [Tetrahymena thermophila SB210]
MNVKALVIYLFIYQQINKQNKGLTINLYKYLLDFKEISINIIIILKEYQFLIDFYQLIQRVLAEGFIIKNMQEDQIISNCEQVKPHFKQKQSPGTFQKLQENVIVLQKDDVRNSSSNNFSNNNQGINNMTPNIKLPLTMVGNVTLSKGMYLTLMKRREQKAFGNTSYSSTPRLQSTQNKIQSNKQYHSCARINVPSYTKLNQVTNQHDFKNVKNSKQNSIKKLLGTEDATYMLRSQVKKEKSNKYKDIHKTKKIDKEKNKKNATCKRKRKNSITSEAEGEFVLKDITRQSQNQNQQNKNKQNVEKSCKDKKVSTQKSISKSKNSQPQKKTQVYSMRERSKFYQRGNQLKKSEQNSKISENYDQVSSKISEQSRESAYYDKENQQMSSNISYSSQLSAGDSNISKNSNLNPFSGLHQSTSMWHEEALDLQTERAMFIQKLKRDKKKKYSQSPKRCVPGFKVKFETSKNKIYSFNCFRDKDLGFDKQHRDTIDLEQDNDYETDCEQIKESILNVFQSLCVAVCEEKINQQIYGKTQSSIY